MPQPISFIRVMRYDFESLEAMRTFIETAPHEVALNGSKGFGPGRTIHSKTMLVDDLELDDIYHGVQQELIFRADLVVAVQPDGTVAIVKNRNAKEGFDAPLVP